MQLPPSFAFDARLVGRFLTLLRSRHDGPVVCEPRHRDLGVGRGRARCCRGTGLLASPPIRRRFQQRRVQAAGRGSSTTACTDRREPTGRATTPSASAPGSMPSRGCRQTSRRGACSTTPRRGRRCPMRSTSAYGCTTSGAPRNRGWTGPSRACYDFHTLSGSLIGDVVDQAGAAVPGAAVTATATATGASRSTSTDGDGRYVVAGLSPGRYSVRIELTGFRPATREAIVLQTGQTLRLDVALRVGGRNEAVTVTAAAPLLRSESSGLGHVIDQRRVVDLPLNGRSFITLASLAPGVALPPPPAAPLPRINGGRPRTNEYLFDGISVLQPEPGQVAFFPNVDAIQEFKIESNSPPAEFGRFNGGVVNLTTKAGSNALHGTGFEFVRHEALNARNVFAPANAGQAALPPQPVRRRRRRPDSQESRPSSSSTTRASARRSAAPSSRRCRRAAAAGRVHRSDRRPRAGRSTIRPRRAARPARRARRSPATPFPTAGSIRSPARCSSAIRCRPAPARPTTTAASATRPSIRTSSACASIISSRRPAISCSRASDPVRRDVRAGDAASGRQRRDDRHPRPAATRPPGRSRQLPAHVLGTLLNELRVGDTRRSVGRAAAS